MASPIVPGQDDGAASGFRIGITIAVISLFFCAAALLLLTRGDSIWQWLPAIVLAIWGGTGLLRGVAEMLRAMRNRH